ncbi:hypothetical protein A8L34_27945 [Bacillus sp. FJAT-27264]|uniref:hypothetical protein n=1 Tax=Paenibacillus sp. (strain DSM 101736 / FJAT-27264) TaxID=1850362 RepID=UPI000807F74E|nr:hypothetical protein [Bacillus sp. FJAT-27264]OBZ15881.1 hypothetical protein A8L34_27945 [Bacillus sp. FJAT-27264]
MEKQDNFIIADENWRTALPQVLRSDYKEIVIGECRSNEAELFLESSNRGYQGTLTMETSFQ